MQDMKNANLVVIGALLGLISCCLITMAVVDLVSAFQVNSPREMTFEEFVDERPTSGYLKLQSGALELIGTQQLYIQGRVTHGNTERELYHYVPIRASLDDVDGKVLLLYEPTDPKLSRVYATINGMRDMQKLGELEEFIKWNSPEPTELKGFLKTPARDLWVYLNKKLGGNLDGNVVLLVEGTKPVSSYLFYPVCALVFTLLTVAYVFMVRKRFKAGKTIVME